jgi:hypothetical protein
MSETDTEAAKEAWLRQRKTMLEAARRAEKKRLKEIDPAFIEEKRLKLEMKEQKSAVQASKKRDQEEKARLQQREKDEHAAEKYARGQAKRDKNRDRMRAIRANEKETTSNVPPSRSSTQSPPPSNVPPTTPPSWRLSEAVTPAWRPDDHGVVPKQIRSMCLNIKTTTSKQRLSLYSARSSHSTSYTRCCRVGTICTGLQTPWSKQ